jgi:subtilisin family serine protease
MRKRSTLAMSLGALASLSLSAAGCGADLADPGLVEGDPASLTASTAFLVSFTGGAIPSNAASIVSAAGGAIVTRYNNVGVVLASSTDAGFASKVKGNSGVDGVGLARSVSSTILPPKPKGTRHDCRKNGQKGTDPLAYRQWDMKQINAEQARAVPGGNRPVLVGVLDSGIDPTHPDLVGQVNAGASVSCIGGMPNTAPSAWSNDLIGHGTHVAGVIAGKKNNVGIVGVAPNAKLAAVKLAIDDVNDPNFGLVFADAFVCAIDWAIGHNFDLMNASLTIDPFTAPIDDIFCSDQPDRAAITRMVARAVGAAAVKNISLIASVGNFLGDVGNLHGVTPGSTCRVLPAGLPGVIGVSSVGVTQQLSYFSDYGQGVVDLTGPGGDDLFTYTPPAPSPPIDSLASGQVLSSIPAYSIYYDIAAGWDGQVQDCSTGTCVTYAYIEGTSQAAPHVTGVAALVTSHFGRLGPAALRLRLSRGAQKLPCPPNPYDPAMTGQPATCTTTLIGNNFYGAGEVNALGALTVN